ncbi:hypothetical protein NSA19_01615 [Actinomyces bowdenii]|nr:hypothetical protein [Actinomyces bowdenii]MCR2051571.1 hypothetical protein [Actinomyces bowdenii]
MCNVGGDPGGPTAVITDGTRVDATPGRAAHRSDLTTRSSPTTHLSIRY